MAFHFRLESVLGHRRHLEDLAMHEYAGRLSTLRECEEQITWLEAEHKRARGEIEQYRVEGMSSVEFQMINEYATVIRLKAMRQRSKIPVLTAQAEEAKGKLIKATQKRKVLETLKEQHLSEYRKQELMREQKDLDEAAVSGFMRKEAS